MNDRDLNLLIDKAIVARVADIVDSVIVTLKPELERMAAESRKLGWTEAELAKEWDVSVETIARIAKKNEIGFTYTIPPTKFVDGKPMNGKRYYLRHHVLSYLRRNETPAKTIGSKDVTFENVYQFEQKVKEAA